MLGEKIGEFRGKVTGQRMLPSDGLPKFETTAEGTGTIHRHSCPSHGDLLVRDAARWLALWRDRWAVADDYEGRRHGGLPRVRRGPVHRPRLGRQLARGCVLPGSDRETVPP